MKPNTHWEIGRGFLPCSSMIQYRINTLEEAASIMFSGLTKVCRLLWAPGLKVCRFMMRLAGAWDSDVPAIPSQLNRVFPGQESETHFRSTHRWLSIATGNVALRKLLWAFLVEMLRLRIFQSWPASLIGSNPFTATQQEPGNPVRIVLFSSMRQCNLVFMMRPKTRTCVALLSLIFLSFARDLRAGVEEKPQFQRALMLATNICAVCHLFPAPDTLDLFTWTNHIKPSMRVKMGVAELENNPSPDARTLVQQWNAIWNDYYLVAAPDKAPPQDPRPPIVPDLTLFKVEDPHYEPTNGYSTMIQIDAQTHQIYVGNALKKSLDVLDAEGRLVGSSKVDSTLTHLLKLPEGWLGTQIGIVPPSDLPLGLVTLYERKENQFEKHCDLLSKLLRPVHTTAADLLGNGRQQLVVCSFGNTGGHLAWYCRKSRRP